MYYSELVHYKFLYFEHFRGGLFKIYRAWDQGGGPEKKPTLYMLYYILCVYLYY